jgi:Zn-dependent M16 (insulinase) family peptidase
LSDISREFIGTDFEKKQLKEDSGVECFWLDQPTNGISFIRMKVDLNDLDPELKRWLPIFNNIYGKMGTQEFKYNEFNDKLMASTTGISISVESFSKSDDLSESES